MTSFLSFFLSHCALSGWKWNQSFFSQFIVRHSQRKRSPLSSCYTWQITFDLNRQTKVTAIINGQCQLSCMLHLHTQWDETRTVVVTRHPSGHPISPVQMMRMYFFFSFFSFCFSLLLFLFPLCVCVHSVSLFLDHRLIAFNTVPQGEQMSFFIRLTKSSSSETNATSHTKRQSDKYRFSTITFVKYIEYTHLHSLTCMKFAFSLSSLFSRMHSLIQM